MADSLEQNRHLPTVRTTSLVVAVIVLAVLAAVIYFSGVLSPKISATRAAVLLKQGVNARKTTCAVNGSGPWDYRCIIIPFQGEALAVEVNVDGHQITSQTGP